MLLQILIVISYALRELRLFTGFSASDLLFVQVIFRLISTRTFWPISFSLNRLFRIATNFKRRASLGDTDFGRPAPFLWEKNFVLRYSFHTVEGARRIFLRNLS